MTNDLILERLERLEEKIDRLSASQEQLITFVRSYENLSDLGRDLSPLDGPRRQVAHRRTGGSGDRRFKSRISWLSSKGSSSVSGILPGPWSSWRTSSTGGMTWSPC